MNTPSKERKPESDLYDSLSKQHIHNLKKKYGLSTNAYKALVESQNYRCKICRKYCFNAKNRVALFVDHNHKTGKIRGLLCHSCNVLLGFADDCPVILLKAIRYLKENS